MYQVKKLQLFAYELSQSTDIGFIALVVGPLPDPADFNQTDSLQRREVIRHRRLRQTDAFLDTADAHTHGMNVPFILGRKVLHRILQPLEDSKACRVRKGFEYIDQFHGGNNIDIYRYVNAERKGTKI